MKKKEEQKLKREKTSFFKEKIEYLGHFLDWEAFWLIESKQKPTDTS